MIRGGGVGKAGVAAEAEDSVDGPSLRWVQVGGAGAVEGLIPRDLTTPTLAPT